MKVSFKISSDLLCSVRHDLARSHEFAAERVGFISASLSAASDCLLILAREFRSVQDGDYLDDPSVGAMLGPDAIRKALQWAMKENVAIFHVHSHSGYGIPRFSRVDLREQSKLVPNFLQVAPKCPHGSIVLSRNAAFGNFQRRDDMPKEVIDEFVEVGVPIKKWNHR